MTNHKWKIGPVKLANGEEAFVDAINEGQEDYRYTGRVVSQGRWEAVGWSHTGRRMYAQIDSDYNLAPPPKKTVRVRASILVYRDGSTTYKREYEFYSKEAKDAAFALIQIDREVTEGEGL
jgi:hypothetical protein